MIPHNIRQKRWKDKNPQYYFEWKKSHPLKFLRANMFNNAKKRVEGKFKDKRWMGFPLLPRQAFNEWFASNKWLLKKMLVTYLKNGKPRNLAPSLNRINPLEGYIPKNIEIITQGENSRIARTK